MRELKYKNNQTVKFILPLLLNQLLGKGALSKNIFRKEFLGAFIGDVDSPKWDGNLVLAYEYPYDVKWASFEKLLLNSGFHMSNYDYEDKKIAIYVLKVPSNLEDDINDILGGFYSKIEPVSKLIISKFWYDFTGSSVIQSLFDSNHDVIKRLWQGWGYNKEERCQPGEYWFTPDIVEEIFNVEDF